VAPWIRGPDTALYLDQQVGWIEAVGAKLAPEGRCETVLFDRLPQTRFVDLAPEHALELGPLGLAGYALEVLDDATRIGVADTRGARLWNRQAARRWRAEEAGAAWAHAAAAAVPVVRADVPAGAGAAHAATPKKSA
jgi:hypothetical protein